MAIDKFFKVKQFLDSVPSSLKSANEIYNFARNKYKQIMGVFPDGIDNIALKRGAAEMQETRNKVVKFDDLTPDPRIIQPKGAKVDTMRAHENISGGSGYAEGDTKYNADILGEEIARMRGLIDEGQDATDMDPKEYSKIYDEAYSYLTALRMLNKKPPGKGELSVTIGGETKNMTPEGIMNFLMKSGKSADTNIGTAPKTTKKKPKVDPQLQKAEDQKQLFMDFEGRIETEAEMLARMKRQNKEAVERLKKKKEKDLGDKLKDLPDDIDPDAMADGGRIGFKNAGFAGDPMEGEQYVMSDIPGSPQVPMGQIGPVNIGIFGGGSYGKNEIVPGVDRATTIQDYGIMGQVPIGNTGFSIGADYMKSRVNERFTGDRIPGQVFKNVPTDSDRFNIGINFRKQFKNGSKPTNFGRRNFLKLMGGLASLPFVGKLFKPAAKVSEAGPVIAEGVKLGFDNFMLLVNKIKSLGKKTDRVTQKEREVGYVYQGKDGNEYELVEDLTTGDIRVTKDKPGIAVANRGTDDVEGIDVIDDRSSFVLKKGETVVDPKKKKAVKTQDEYDEMRELPDEDGTFTDVDEVKDQTVMEILEEIKDVPIKKAGGGLAYMLGE